jgi:hypothetical protein
MKLLLAYGFSNGPHFGMFHADVTPEDIDTSEVIHLETARKVAR